MRIVFLLVAVLFLNQPLFSQWANNEDPLTIKELKLTPGQQKQIKQINKHAAVEIGWLKKNNDSGVTVTSKIEKIKGARIKKIRNVLTAEQQTIWRNKLMKNKPGRGVTGLPYERTAH